MIRINFLNPLGLFLVPKPNFTEYLKTEAFTPNISSLYSHVSSHNVTNADHTSRVFAERAIVRDLVRVRMFGKNKSWNVLEYLANAKAKETVAQFCTDLELSWFTVLRASEGHPDPWNFSFWMFFGKTYPKALLAWAERDEINRKALERCAAMVRANERPHNQRGFTRGEEPLGNQAIANGTERPAANLYRTASEFLNSTPPKKPRRAA